MIRVIALAACLVACGRWSFDPHGDGGSSNGDGANGDGATDGGGGEPLYSRALYIKASNPTAGDQFGHALALSADGATIAVGAPLEASEAGAVYVFRRAGDVWIQETIVKPNIQDTFDQFGWSVALSDDGNTLAVGARREDSAVIGVNGDATNNGASGSGAAYVFVRTSSWSQQAYIKASNTDPDDSYGESIALSGDGNTLAVGAHREDSASTIINGNQASNTADAAGAVYVYTRITATWTQQAYVKSSNAEPADEFGWRIALARSGDVMVVGAYREDSGATGVGGNQVDDAATNAGAAYVFARTGPVWSQTAYLKASNTELGDNFGFGVAISSAGTRIAVAAESESSGARGIDGAQNNNNAMTSGAVYVLDRGATTWMHTAYAKSSNSDAGDQLGFCLALAGGGDRLLGGAVDEDSAATGIDGDQTSNALLSAGAAYVFRDAPWSHGAYLKATNPGMDDRFGWSCALSHDGATVVIGAPFEDGGGAGIGPGSSETAADAGAIYVFD